MFILGVLICYKQLYESSKLIAFGKVKALLKNTALVDSVSWLIFGPKLAAILDFQPFRDNNTIFKHLNHIHYLQKHIFGDKLCVFVWLEIDIWKILFLVFGFLVEAAILKMPQENECVPKFPC